MMVRLVGITGGLGAGKSVVSRVLRCKGYPVYDCDSEARRIMESSSELKRGIRETIGEECVDEEGRLCRPAIARKVFADSRLLEWLNSSVHGLVREDVERWSAAQDSGSVFVESAILVTSGLADMCREIWLVVAPEQLRVERGTGRDHATPEQVRARIKAQSREFSSFPGGIPVKRIVNDGVTPLLPVVTALLNETLHRIIT